MYLAVQEDSHNLGIEDFPLVYVLEHAYQDLQERETI